ncbi:MAG: GNAT family N-acetyltransferase [Sporichthyaceae bacterium]
MLWRLAHSITPEDVGARVSVRRMLPEGGMADAVGVLLRWSEGVLAVQRRDGTVVEIAQDTLVAGKRVPPRPAIARSHSQVSVRDLQEVAAAGWPAPETHSLGDWLLRAGGGWTMRANSVLALGDPGCGLAEALAQVRAWYAERSLPARFCLPLPLVAELDATLAEHGWTGPPDNHEVLLLTGDTAALDGPSPERPPVRLTASPSPEWLVACSANGPVPDVGVQVLTAPESAVFGEVHQDGAVVAIGRATVERGWVGITTVEVRPDARRRGLARQVVAALVAHGRAQGARHAYLQVSSSNTPARALYDAMGLTVHHVYRYRVAP